MTELAGISGAPGVIKPGMSHVVNAGETLVIRDNEGQEISVEAREHDDVMAFLVAYDDLRVARARGMTTGLVFEALRDSVERAWNSLPAHVTRRLPTASARGLVVR